MKPLKSGDYTLKPERLHDIRHEITGLLNEHRDEVGSFGDKYPVDPDWQCYNLLDSSGLLHILCLRHGFELVGYYISLITRHPHYEFTTAENDIIFIHPLHRGTIALKFFNYIDKYLLSHKVNFANIGVKPMRDFSPILKRMGYKLLETRYYKEIQ